MPPPYPDPQSFTNNKAVVAATIASGQTKSPLSESTPS